MDKYIEFLLFCLLSIMFVILLIMMVPLVRDANFFSDTRCINGYVFTNTQNPVQILDSNKTPIKCEVK